MSELGAKWLNALGYGASDVELGPASDVSPRPYRSEVCELIDADGDIRAKAVYSVGNVPTVCFLESDRVEESGGLEHVRARIWNQNLISIVVVLEADKATAFPAGQIGDECESVTRDTASASGRLSKQDIRSGEIYHRHVDWFRSEDRVDQTLLKNIVSMVGWLSKHGFDRETAQFLLAQILFVSYLEDREIVGETYRAQHGLQRFRDLLCRSDIDGVVALFRRLKDDFNGDFLLPSDQVRAVWERLPENGISRIDRFLKREDLASGQTSLWPYDFKYIPVELLSGIYETFLTKEKKETGVVYTPRLLANLAVDLAFKDSTDLLAERIYDGACGSGILLTTAYRRILGFAAAKKGSNLSFTERSDILTNQIFGSDISTSACRVTAFSLYLSLLEGLQPSDIQDLRNRQDVKLPTLEGKNIIGGPENGDFFSPNNPLATSARFSVFLCNPPWVEPKRKQGLRSDTWASDNNKKLARRNTAGAFMHAARQSVCENAVCCMILPVSIVAAPTSQAFLRQWLESFMLHEIINLGDLRKILFSRAKQPTLLVRATPRKDTTAGGPELFEYCTPKADVGFAFGRLTLHPSDRHTVTTQSLFYDNEILTTLFWGSRKDAAFLAQLRMQGELAHALPKRGIIARKGFHKTDRQVEQLASAAPLKSIPYLDTRRFSDQSLVLSGEQLAEFPPDRDFVAALPDELLTVFRQPKVLFPDGLNAMRRPRVAFSEAHFSFPSTLGVISGNARDAKLLLFIAAYLRSRLAHYFLMMTSYQICFERDRVTVKQLLRLPFVLPDDHKRPQEAWQIVNELHERAGSAQSEFMSVLSDELDVDELIFSYFEVSREQRERVLEVSHDIAPHIQPTSIDGLGGPLQQRASSRQLESYGSALRTELLAWKEARGGSGDVRVRVVGNTSSVCGPVGVVQLTLESEPQGQARLEEDDALIEALLGELHERGLYPMKQSGSLSMVTDIVVRINETLMLVKPRIKRFWLRSEAYSDAARIVRHVAKGTRH